jgi:hypothetical protein
VTLDGSVSLGSGRKLRNRSEIYVGEGKGRWATHGLNGRVLREYVRRGLRRV